MSDIEVTRSCTVPLAELVFSTSRSGGPGGQHVNTTESRVTLRWRPAESVALTDAQRERVLGRLASRLTSDGDLLLHCDTHRSQQRNREDVVARFVEIVRAALHVERARRATKPSRGAIERRLEAKRRNSDKKRQRGGGEY
ncbi:MAG: aminoacyl-tRNA hydrolase [Myxococcales bacterium]|nr:aminoacyl-tRNA hydrolase [Myxococcales bacterium]MCB9530888.1 aminoacyl-tRNA hydrolase [Myxococcales bacterium]